MVECAAVTAAGGGGDTVHPADAAGELSGVGWGIRGKGADDVTGGSAGAAEGLTSWSAGTAETPLGSISWTAAPASESCCS